MATGTRLVEQGPSQVEGATPPTRRGLTSKTQRKSGIATVSTNFKLTRLRGNNLSSRLSAHGSVPPTKQPLHSVSVKRSVRGSVQGESKRMPKLI